MRKKRWTHQRDAVIGFKCARRATTASSWGLREHGNRHHSPPLSPHFYSLPSTRGFGTAFAGDGGVVLNCATFSRTRPRRAKTRPCPSEGRMRSRVARAKRTVPPSIFPPSLPNDRESFCKGAVAGFYCAHRTSTVSSCAFCEQGSRHDIPPLLLPPPPKDLEQPPMGMVRLSSTARVQRGPSQAARCASKEDGPTIPFFTSTP